MEIKKAVDVAQAPTIEQITPSGKTIPAKFAKSNGKPVKKETPKNLKPFDPVSFYNCFAPDHCKALLLECKNPQFKEVSQNCFNSIVDGTTIKTVFENGLFKSDQPGGLLDPEVEYTPFMVLSLVKFKGNHYMAFDFVANAMMQKDPLYIRIGVSYYKKSTEIDAYCISRQILLPWNRQTLTDDIGTKGLQNIAKYDGFTMQPNNLKFEQIIDNKWNLYQKFEHEAKEGSWAITEMFLNHVFGEQYETALIYLQVLYTLPMQKLPILALVSKSRETGKTTFLNWIAAIFGGNFRMIEPSNIANHFNEGVAKANILGLEETKSDKSEALEALKRYSTSKVIEYTQKFKDSANIPFYGKFILTSNFPEHFLKVDTDEVRFWVRVLSKPKNDITDLENALKAEIPAFLHHLKNMPKVKIHSRLVFTPEQLHTKALDSIKEQSHSYLYKEIKEHLQNVFSNNELLNEFYAHPLDIKNRFFFNNNRIEVSYIRQVLKDEFGMVTGEYIYYRPFGEEFDSKKNRVFKFERKNFVNDMPFNDELH